MKPVVFDDLMMIRKGGEGLEMGDCPSTVESIRSKEEWEEKAEALQEIFLDILGERPDLSCDPETRVLSEERREGYLKRTVSYLVAPGERVNSYLLLPDSRQGTVPGVVAIHQTAASGKRQPAGEDPESNRPDMEYGLHLVRRGYAVFLWDIVTAGERISPGLKSFDTAQFYREHPRWSARGKDLADAKRAVDVFCMMPEVDSRRIGSIGHSQGGGITVHSMALDPRISVGVSSCGFWPDRLSKNPYNWARTGWWVGIPKLRPYCCAGKDFPLDFHEYFGLIAPRPFLNILALNDWMYGDDEEAVTRAAFENLAENVEKIYGLYGTREKFRQVLHMEGHGFSESARAVAYDFLDRHLNPMG